MKLSICMMVKNEEKYLDRCLSAMRELMEGVLSELIVVDTGSKDNTVDIAKKYTGKVYFHEWNDNFSEMRNKTISYASGEWLFFIDADEILVDAANMLEFLKSKANNKFNAGFITIKNIVREDDESTVPSFSAVKLFRNGNIRYEGAIHNMPIYEGPIADLDTEVLHYGYITNDKDLMKRKFQRTSKILKQEIEKNPLNLYYIHQLSVSYRMHGDYNEALDQEKKAYELFKKSSADPQKFKFIYYQLALCYYDFSDYENVEKICIEGIGVEKQYIDLYYYLATSQVYLRKFDSAIENYNTHISLIQNYDKLEIRKDLAVSMYTLSYLEHDYYSLALCYYAKQDFDKCLEYLGYIKGDKRIGDAINLTIKVIIETKKYNKLLNYYNSLLENNPFYSHLFIDSLEKQKTTSSLEVNENIDFSLIGTNDSYLLLNSIRYNHTLNNRSMAINNIKDLLKIVNINEVRPYYGDIIYFLMKFCEPIEKCIASLSKNKLDDFLLYLNNKYQDLEAVLYKYISDNQNNSDDNLYYLMINKALERTLLTISKPNNTQFNMGFNSYINDGLKYVKSLYGKAVLENEAIYSVISDEDRFLLYMTKALEFKNNDIKNYISYLRKALAAYPTMKSGIEILLRQTEQLVKDNKKDELEEYKKQFKEKITSLISGNFLEESKRLIEDYEKIVHNDIEVYSMKAIIYIMEGTLDKAEKTLLEGLKYDSNNFDLLYNSGYLYEVKGNFRNALIYYKRARDKRYYDLNIKKELDSIIFNIFKLQKKQKEHEDYSNCRKVESVLLIDFEANSDILTLAEELNCYGINVDLACGFNYINRFKNTRAVPFRKCIGFIEIEEIIEYSNYYSYDIVHVFYKDKYTLDYVKDNCKCRAIFGNNLDYLKENIKTNNDQEKKIEIRNEDYSVESNKLTILIPTYNRPEYLQRVLSYLQSFYNIRPTIFVLDSSCDSDKVINEEIVKSLNQGNISYWHYESNIEFFTKLNYGIKNVFTEYIAMCADDDFLTEEGIIESIKTLDKKRDLFSVKGRNLFYIDSLINLKEYDFFQGLFDTYPTDRLKNITKGFVPSLIYQVFRKGQFEVMYRFIEDNITILPINPTFREYLFYFMVIITGKIGKIAVDLNIRDKSVPREQFIKNFPHAVLDGTFNDDYKKFYVFLCKYIDKLGTDKQYFDKSFSEIFCNFLTNFLRVPNENIVINENMFDIKQLEIGMRKSWVWPRNL
jgi:glycosyltransferase domain-containing protein